MSDRSFVNSILSFFEVLSNISDVLPQLGFKGCADSGIPSSCRRCDRIYSPKRRDHPQVNIFCCLPPIFMSLHRGGIWVTVLFFHYKKVYCVCIMFVS